MTRLLLSGLLISGLSAFCQSSYGQTGTTATGSTGSTGGNTSASSGSSASGSSPGTTTAASSMTSAPILQAPSLTSSGNTTQVSSSNFLGPTFGQPYYQGTISNSRNFTAPGGFGKTLFTASSGTSGTATGGRGGASGILADQGGSFVQIPRQIAYTAQLQFVKAPGASEKLISDLRSTLPSNVSFQMDGNSVILRGRVQTSEQAQLAEGLTRLTPGVGQIKNEITVSP